MLNDLIVKRKSIKEFANKTLSSEEIISLFDAARRAPSAFNEQPWRFIIAQRDKKEEFDLMLETLSEKNQQWAKSASLLVIVLSKKISSKTQKLNRHYLYDTASAVANLTYQALSFNLYVHQMGGFDSGKVINNFSIPDDFDPAVILAIGEKTTSNEVDFLKQSELNRLPIKEILFEEKFGSTSDMLDDKNESIN